MADFCKQCSEELFGKDFRELADITTITDEQESRAALVICEGCGPIQVNNKGECISEDCLKEHKNIT